MSKKFLTENKLIVGLVLLTVCLATTAVFLKKADPDPAPKMKTLTYQELQEKEEIVKENLMSQPGLLHYLTLISIFILASGVFADIFLFQQKLKGKPLIPHTLPHRQVPWGFKALIEIVAFFFFVESVMVLGQILAKQVFGIQTIDKEFYALIVTLVRDIAVAAFVIWLVRKKYHCGLEDIGLTKKNIFSNIRIGAALYVAIIPILFLMLMGISILAEQAKYQPPAQQVVQIYLQQTSTKFVVVLTLFVAIVGPIIEEIFFRGFAYKALRTKWGVKGGMIASALFFAVLHGNLLAFVPIFFLGLWLTFLYERSGSLVPSMTLHMMHNFLMSVFMLIFKTLS